MKQTPPLPSYKPCWEEADGTTRERPPDKVSDPRGTGAGSPQTLTTAYAAVSVHARANGGLWDWRQQSRGSPTTTPKRASEPLCHSHCLSCAPSKLVFHSFLQGASTSEELEASCTVQPLHKVRTERGTARRFHFTLEKISLLLQQVGRTAHTMSRKKLLSSGRCIQHPQQRVKEPFISSVWPGFFFPSRSSSQTPSLSERRCPYT